MRSRSWLLLLLLVLWPALPALAVTREAEVVEAAAEAALEAGAASWTATRPDARARPTCGMASTLPAPASAPPSSVPHRLRS